MARGVADRARTAETGTVVRLSLRALGLASVALLALEPGCSPGTTSSGPVADPEPPPSTVLDDGFGAAAYARLVTLMALPRALGHADRAASVDALERMLLQLGAPSVLRFEAAGDDPLTGQSYLLTSLVAHMRPDARRRLVLASHFDTRPWSDEAADPADRTRPVPGANDGTSGVAVVLELAARLPERLPSDVGVTIVLFDGEELGRPGFEGGYCVGSRDLAQRILAGDVPELSRAELGVVLDMVGDADLDVPIEPGSLAIQPELVRHVWATARRLGHVQLRAQPRRNAIYDDHRPLTDAGIPSILLIDHDYAHWHTPNDTIDRVSAESLGAVGHTVLEALASWYAR